MKGKSEVKVVVVTGASAGIGASVAREAARKGYSLVLVARRVDRLERLAAEIHTSAAAILILPMDLADPDAPQRIVAASLNRFGKLDVLINNAGIGLPTLFAESNPEEIRTQIEVNLIAPLMLIRHALPALLESGGMIINVGSAISALPNPALGAYGTTKAALAYFSSALRRELLHKGVQVCLVEPGPVKTEFFEAFTKLGPVPGMYHPMLDAPAPWMSARVEVVAKRIVHLIERPKRRLSVLKRFVWLWRSLGLIFQFCPALGDVAVSFVVRHSERPDPLTIKDREAKASEISAKS